MFTQQTWNRIYDSEHHLVTLSRGIVTMTVVEHELVADDENQRDECEQQKERGK